MKDVPAADLEKFNADLSAPLPGSDPDRVSDRIADDEMDLFNKAMRGQ